MPQDVTIDAPDIAEGRSACLVVAGRAVIVVRAAEGVRAFDARCPHQGRSLEGALVRNGSIVCPWHGALFAVRDGASLTPMSRRGLESIPCEAVDGRLVLRVST